MHSHIRRTFSVACLFCIGLIGLIYAAKAVDTTLATSSENPVPLQRAHAHNDYEHRRPLLDALECGFCSVEADIFLVNGELLVAHSRLGLKSDRTLDRMYLQPLAERVKLHHGSVYAKAAPVTLLIDIKEDGKAIYPVLKKKLHQFAPIWTHYSGTNVVPGAITVVLSGDRPTDLVKVDMDRDCALDGPMEALDQNWPVTLAPLVSDSWDSQFAWNGEGMFPAEQEARLIATVNRAHEQGKRIRFWALPDRPEAWSVAYRAGVDLVNTDKLPALRDFLLKANPEGR